MARIVALGPISEEIRGELENAAEEEIMDRIEELEKKLEADGYALFWLSEGCDDYAEIFVNREGEMLFLLATVEGTIYLVDWEEIARDPAIANAYVYFTRNYFRILAREVTGK